jgi:uncharacterized protein YheU (UPF0270 family)|tara:strand:- start:587 stop:853 length:267 start_codon:yes stop_codon:yes gene_type:complete
VIEIPSERLTDDTLNAVIEEYILREGTDYGVQEISLQSKIKQVESQLARGDVLITFDQATETCTLLTRHQFRQFTEEQRSNNQCENDA